MKNAMRPCLPVFFFILFLVPSGTARAADKPSPAPGGWASGTGMSYLSDPRAAGAEAAAMAKAALGNGPARFVMVAAAIPQVTPELIAGVTEHFPADVVYGCQASNPLNRRGPFTQTWTLDIDAGVVVWALGGDTDVHVEEVTVPIEDDDAYFTAGLELAGKLAPVLENIERPGKLVFTWGDQYTGSNKDFAAGMNVGFGRPWPVVGGAAGNSSAKIIVRGEIKTGINLAMVMSGEFRVGMGMHGGTHTPDTVDKTLLQALEQSEGGEPFFALIFNCRRRRRAMFDSGSLGSELENIQKHLPGVDFFGYYAPGEIGSEQVGRPSRGAGFTVTAAVLFTIM